MFHQTFFGKGPESFSTVDADYALFESVVVVDSEIPVSAEHERIGTSPFVGINDRPAPDLLNRFIHQGFFIYIRENAD
jgi:hypothetical protein